MSMFVWGFFTQDDLEHHFAHFKRSSGCNFYITVKEVFATHSLDRARLLLNTFDSLDLSVDTSHTCDLCTKLFTDEELLLLDELVDVANCVSKEVKASVFYIAGFIASKHNELSGDKFHFDGNDCVTGLVDHMDRGDLSYPSKEFYGLVLLCYTFFSNSSHRMCRNRLVNLFSQFSTIFHLDMNAIPKPALTRLANVLLKQFAFFNNRHNFGNNTASIVKLSSQGSSRQ